MADKSEVLSRIPEKLHKDLDVLSKHDLNRSTLYHISDNERIKEFIPRVTNRMLSSENRSIPRVSCSLDLAGAIAGHDGTEHLFSDMDFNGIFQVYALPFEFCIKPKGKLVADGLQTREHWLVTYNRETESYEPIKIARFFYDSVRLYRPKQEIVYEMIIEVNQDDVYLTPQKLLDKGYWRVVGRSPRVFKKRSATRKPMSIDSMEMITKDEWKKLKDSQVTMEAFGDSAVMSW
jgi:hypothetical protein